jgi:hypothetical protein
MNGQWRKGRTRHTNTVDIFRNDSAAFNDFVQLRPSTMNDDGIETDTIEKAET